MKTIKYLLLLQLSITKWHMSTLDKRLLRIYCWMEGGAYTMSSRSLNKVQLIGNITRDPEVKKTQSGGTVATFSIATNRSWKVDGEAKEEVEFHRIVAWDKLAELCEQLLTKGRKIYVEGRIQTRKYEDSTGQQKESTEIVIDDMILLDSKKTIDTSEPAF
jgi:single-strand DNA-binding protein